MNCVISDFDFAMLEAEKYWSFPSSYTNDRKKQETINMIYSSDYLGARKMDGAYYRFCKDLDGNMCLQGRSKSVKGAYLNKIDWVPQLQPFFDSMPNGTCLLGEIYFPDNEGSYNTTTIMGCKVDKATSRQSTGPKLHYYIFDIWAYEGKSFLNVEAKKRFEVLEQLANEFCGFSCVDFAHYYSGAELWNVYQKILADGGEGVVITKKTSKPEPGKRTARKTLKLKKELQETLDVIIIGANEPTRLYNGKEITEWMYWEDPTTGGKYNADLYKEYSDGMPIEPVTKMYYLGGAGSLKIGVYKKGKVVQIGSLSGIDDDVLLNWKTYVGKVVEITAMEVMQETKGLRHPRLVGFRDDKTPKDCQWELIFGEDHA